MSVYPAMHTGQHFVAGDEAESLTGGLGVFSEENKFDPHGGGGRGAAGVLNRERFSVIRRLVEYSFKDLLFFVEEPTLRNLTRGWNFGCRKR